ncbi:MAG: peptidoglycan DD-metalloendopeptidase family protein [Polaromonas sp.]|nr:peptidoglycan DD-metalloendopeptidase family protein [Polaromonas sp.]
MSCVLAAAVVLASGCGTRLGRAPVEDRGTSTSRVAVPAAGAVDAGGVRMPSGFENAGKPGYYTVKPGDTLIRIGLDTGQNWRDIGRWNNLENPNLIEVGQVLRVVPPADNALVHARPVNSGSATPTPAAGAAKPAASAVPAPPSAGSEDDIAWIWPVQGAGTVLAGFDEAKNKGLDIAGKPGDTVLASADGRVVYAGAGLRGYGNLIILKHNNTFLTAYAHNQTLLVKEDQTVRKGQKIAEMGDSDADRVKLHFEIRRQGKPVDPAKYLPAK